MGKKKGAAVAASKAALKESIQVKKVHLHVHKEKVIHYDSDDKSQDEAESCSSSDSDLDDVSFWDQKIRKTQLTSEHEKIKRVLRAKTQILIVEGNYTYKELLIIPDDVYNMTIAANLSGKCSPSSVIFSLRQCIFVFIVQAAVPILFSY